ncbi:MAG TPA: patatin-like phospholipase family protein [Dehalococcoidales bacterium]
MNNKMNRKKVGLALGGGAARGLAHIGVLEVLERESIPIDMIAGTSMGAIIGAFYAHTRDINLIKDLAVEVGKHRIRFFTDLTIPRTGILRWKWVEDKLKRVIGGVRFEDLKIPFSCVAVDIDNGEELILNEGLVWDAARASATVPVALSINPWKNRYLVDGGVSNPVPVSVLKQMGADFIIAVNVLHDTANVADHEPSKKEKAREHNIFTIMAKTMYIVSYRVIGTSLGGADVVIEPDMIGINFTDFQRAKECIKRGALVTQKAIPEIKRRLSLAE